MTIYAKKLVDRFLADCRVSGSISEVEAGAVARIIAEWDQANILSKLRYINLLVGEGAVWRKNLLPFGTQIVDVGAPSVAFSSRAGLSITGAANSALRANFTPSTSGVGLTGSFRGAYILKPATAGVVFGGGDTPGSVYTGNYLGFATPAPGQSRVSGASVQFDKINTGLQSCVANQSTIFSQWRYRQIQSISNPALPPDAPNQGSLILNHFNGGNNFMSDARVGALVEGFALSRSEVSSVSSALDRFNFAIGRKAALSGVFLGDSITLGVGVSNAANRYSSQVSASLGVAEINRGVSGSCAQAGSGDGIATPAINRYVADVIDQVPSFVFICLGANDIYRANDYTVEGFQHAIGKMIDDMIVAGISPRNIFLATPPYTADSWYSNNPVGSRKKALDYMSATYRIAESKNVVIVDIYTPMQTQGAAALLSDGLHPNDSGAQVIAQAFIKAFELEMYA
jgi:lysophospholipase L1-like esterase